MDKKLIYTIFKAVGLAMGIASLVLIITKASDTQNIITLLAIGMVCLGITALNQK